MAKIANVASTNTFDAWRSRSNIGFDRLSQFAINNSSLYANTITANVAFTSTGLATLSGRATVGTNLTVSGNTSTNKATVTSSLTVSGNTTLGAAGKTITTTGAAAHTGTKTISTNLTVSGNTTLAKTLVVTADTNSLAVVIKGRSSDNLGAMYFYANDGTTNYATITTSATEFRSSAVPAASVQTFYTNASERMRIDASGNVLINGSGANGVYSNTASFGIFSNNVNFTNKKLRNFTEDLMSYRASSTAITLTTQRNAQRISLTGNATVTLPTGMPGSTEAIKSLVVIFKQDGTGGRTMAFAAPAGESLLYNNSATLPAVSTGANKVTIYVCTKFDGDTRWYIAQSFIEA